MRKRVLGRTGLEISEIGVGAWQLGGPLVLNGKADGHPDPGREHVISLIRQCGEMGLNFIDTAEQYGAGESERRVGEALKGQRDRWVISTKFGALVGPRGERVDDASAKRVALSLEGSLRRLGTDRIDVYLYHVTPDRKQADAVAKFLESARHKGQVRAVGISTNDLEQVRMLHELGCCDVVEYERNMLRPEEGLTAYLREHNIGGVVRGALAAGRLSGKYFRRPPELSAEDIRSTWFAGQDVGKEFRRYAVFGGLVRPGRTMVQVALRYLLDDPATHTVVLGAKSIDEYRDAVAATELSPLTEGERRTIAELRRRLREGPALKRMLKRLVGRKG